MKLLFDNLSHSDAPTTNTYNCTITYAVPCRLGGIESKDATLTIFASSDEDAEKEAKIKGVSDPHYLYTIMTDTKRVFN